MTRTQEDDAANGPEHARRSQSQPGHDTIWRAERGRMVPRRDQLHRIATALARAQQETAGTFDMPTVPEVRRERGEPTA